MNRRNFLKAASLPAVSALGACESVQRAVDGACEGAEDYALCRGTRAAQGAASNTGKTIENAGNKGRAAAEERRFQASVDTQYNSIRSFTKDDQEKVQQFLKDAGQTIEVDGAFGPGSKKALENHMRKDEGFNAKSIIGSSDAKPKAEESSQSITDRAKDANSTLDAVRQIPGVGGFIPKIPGMR